MKGGLTLTIRKIKVFQLNSILHIIRELKVEEAKLAELLEEKKAIENSIHMVDEGIQVLKATIRLPYLNDNICSSLSDELNAQTLNKNSLVLSMEELSKQIYELKNIVDFKRDLCESTMKLLINFSPRENPFDLFGFLYITELQEEYKDEYLYLLDKSKMENCISPYALFAGTNEGVNYELKESIRHFVIKYDSRNQYEDLLNELIALSKS